MLDELNRLVAISPPELADVNAAVREVCASTLGLPPLPAESTGGAVDPMVTEFAEQFSADVSVISGAQRAAFTDLLGRKVSIRARSRSNGITTPTPRTICWTRSCPPSDGCVSWTR